MVKISWFKWTVLYLFGMMLWTSCFKEEEKVPMPPIGDNRTAVADIGKDYQWQVFYDLTNNAIVSSNLFTDWDLAFECKTDGWHIILNSAKMMHAGNTQDTVFENPYHPDDYTMKFGHSSGNLDSTAIGEWYKLKNEQYVSKNTVFIIDRGYDLEMQQTGYKKAVFSIVDSNYKIRYANLDGSEEAEYIITKNDDYSFAYFSFENGQVSIAPKKTEWSLLFTKYTTMLVTNEGENYPYLLTGTLLNPHSVTAALDTTDFYFINLETAIEAKLSNQADIIGYDWKHYDFDAEIYSIVPNRHYLIQNHDGLFYKMRFTDFYNPLGEKGSIAFESVGL